MNFNFTKSMNEESRTGVIGLYQQNHPLFKWYYAQPERMVPEEKAKLTKALRSGDYKQTVGRLKGSPVDNRNAKLTDVGYCCLGVATDIKVLEGIGYWTEKNQYIYNQDSMSIDGVLEYHLSNILHLNPVGRFATWMEATWMEAEESREIKYDDYDLASLNDSGFTFNQIADVIDYFL